jgi:hypothetical protein
MSYYKIYIIILLLVSCNGFNPEYMARRDEIKGPHSTVKPPQLSAYKNKEKIKKNIDEQNNKNICKKIIEDKEDIKKSFNISDLKKIYISGHNKIRKLYNLENLEWDDTIAAYAQEWADYLKEDHNCDMHHRSALNRRDNKRYGENLAVNWYSLKIAPDEFFASPHLGLYGWASECLYYDYEQNSCEAQKMCGHYTQMVWRTTKKFGCGVAHCDEGIGTYKGKGRKEIWVCNYDPPGNMIINGQRLKPY